MRGQKRGFRGFSGQIRVSKKKLAAFRSGLVI